MPPSGGTELFGTSAKGVNDSTGILKAGTSTLQGDAASVDGSLEGTIDLTDDTLVTGYDGDIQTAITKSAAIKGYAITVGGTAYYAIDSTAATQKEGEQASVSQVVDYINKLGEQGAANNNGVATAKAFASMDEMMAAIKNDNGTHIKAISSYVATKADGGNDISTVGSLRDNIDTTWLKVETFADLNSAVDLSLHVGADSSADNKINMNIAMMSAKGLGINGLKVNGDNSDNATGAIDTIAAAMQKVSNQRASYNVPYKVDTAS